VAVFRLMIAGGGTGGHVFPGIAVADALARRVRDLDVLWVGTARGIEARVLPTTPWRFEAMELTGLNGVRGRALLTALGKLPRAGAQAYNLLRSNRPHAVLGVGGYAAGPLTAMAAALGVPAAVLEPNAIPGLTNRLLARFVRRAFVTHEETLGAFPRGVAEVTGSPVRRGFLKRMGSDVPTDAPLHVLVVGRQPGRARDQRGGARRRGRARVAGTARHGDAPDRRGEPRRGGRALRGAGGRGRGAGLHRRRRRGDGARVAAWCAARAR
jgi:UDP-N-acetylglucosamine--N-acetylmuramyl-(pentapeptide) pyrophosphoryl-undecaprenol N-acetylglucosamine transferase